MLDDRESKVMRAPKMRTAMYGEPVRGCTATSREGRSPFRAMAKEILETPRRVVSRTLNVAAKAATVTSLPMNCPSTNAASVNGESEAPRASVPIRPMAVAATRR